VYWKSYFIVGYIENSMDWNHFNIILVHFIGIEKKKKFLQFFCISFEFTKCYFLNQKSPTILLNSFIPSVIISPLEDITFI